MTWYVVDGMDGCGKSTFGEQIRDTLEARGRKVLFISHPNPECFWGRIEKKSLMKEGKVATAVTTMLYIADVVSSLFRARRSRKNYDDVVFVRYIMAVCYLPQGIVKKGYKVISHVLPMPDVKILIDVDAKTAMSRIIARGEEREGFEKEDKLAQIRSKMMLVTEEDDWYIVDNSGTLENSRSQIDEIVKKEMSD